MVLWSVVLKAVTTSTDSPKNMAANLSTKHGTELYVYKIVHTAYMGHSAHRQCPKHLPAMVRARSCVVVRLVVCTGEGGLKSSGKLSLAQNSIMQTEKFIDNAPVGNPKQ